MLLTLGKDDLSDRKHTLAWKGLPLSGHEKYKQYKEKRFFEGIENSPLHP